MEVRIGIYNTLTCVMEFERKAEISDDAVKLHTAAYEAYIIKRPEGFSEAQALETWVLSIGNHEDGLDLPLNADFREVHKNFDKALEIIAHCEDCNDPILIHEYCSCDHCLKEICINCWRTTEDFFDGYSEIVCEECYEESEKENR